jgi:hypothetical protein
MEIGWWIPTVNGEGHSCVQMMVKYHQAIMEIGWWISTINGEGHSFVQIISSPSW